MAYSLINGAAINGDEGESPDRSVRPAGMDLVSEGLAAAVLGVDAQGERPLEFGGLVVVRKITPDGLDAVSAGTATGLFDALLQPDGIDLVTAGSATTAVVANATGSAVMEFGSLRVRNGVDVVVSPAGMDMVRPGLHIADVGMPPPIVAVSVAGSAVLEFGDLVVQRSGVTVDAAGSAVMEFGSLSFGWVGSANGASPLEFGGLRIAEVATAEGSAVMEFGNLATQHSLGVLGGLGLGASGTHTAAAAGSSVVASGGAVMEFGDLQSFGIVVFPRSSIPLAFGSLQMGRGASC